VLRERRMVNIRKKRYVYLALALAVLFLSERFAIIQGLDL
jgi:hypothetical protein